MMRSSSRLSSFDNLYMQFKNNVNEQFYYYRQVFSVQAGSLHILLLLLLLLILFKQKPQNSNHRFAMILCRVGQKKPLAVKPSFPELGSK
jgi:hypothetical protein